MAEPSTNSGIVSGMPLLATGSSQEPNDDSRCGECNSDEPGKMVQCDLCAKWFHFTCANVGDSIADRELVCTSCRKPDRSFSRHSSKSSLMSTSSTKQKNLLLLKKLEEERASERKYLDEKYRLLQLIADDDDDEKQANQVLELGSISSVIPPISTVAVTGPSVQHTSASIDTHCTVFSDSVRVAPRASAVAFNGYSMHNRVSEAPLLLNSFPQPHCNTVPSSYPVATNAFHLSDDDDDKEHTNHVIELGSVMPPISSVAVTGPSIQHTSVNIGTHCSGFSDNIAPQANAVSFIGCSMHNHVSEASSLLNSLPQPHCNTVSSSYPVATNACHLSVQPSAQVHHGGFPTVPTVSNVSFNQNNPYNTTTVITSSQLAARQVISKDLPQFTGHPNEWALFISSFENSTRICGFSNSENLIRLQKSLKGKALEAVKYRLLLPESVPQVIETLRFLFGRPEIMVNSLLQVIRSHAPLRQDKLETIINYSLVVQNLCDTIKASGLVSHLESPTLLYELVDKLPSQVKLSWALHKQGVRNANVEMFGNWLHQIARAASEVTIPDFSDTSSNKKPYKGQPFLHHQSNNNTSDVLQPENKCLICQNSNHKVEFCRKFINSNHSEKWSLVKQCGLCRKCLQKHSHYNCRNGKRCGENGCQFYHHRLLHNYAKDSQVASSHAVNPANIHLHSSTTLFRIIPVKIFGKDKVINSYAFLDEGSSVTLIEHSIARELGLSGLKDELCLQWTANTSRVERDSMRVTIEISGTYDSATKHKMHDVRTVENLSLPVQTLSAIDMKTAYDHLRGIPLESYNDARPKLLIGMDNYKLGIPLRIREGSPDEPAATKTRLGWAIHGRHVSSNPTALHQLAEHHNIHSCECSRDIELSQLLRGFFSMSNIGVKIPDSFPESLENKRALEILDRTTVRVGSRFMTGLLWKSDDVSFPDSFPMAYKRLQCLENRMAKDKETGETLQNTIDDYLRKGYIRALSEEELSTDYSRIWYLPIFTVTNPNKPGKMRVVWDAAATVGGVSLNAALLKGPDELISMIFVMYQFRERLIALTGDICEMFHQILIQPEDQHSQRFLWRDTTKQVIVYVIQVVIFGAASSPCTAQYVKNRNARSFAQDYPKAAEAILENHYVDDLLISVDTEPEAIKLGQEIKYIHEKGGFEIRNFNSNSTRVLDELGAPSIKDSKNMNLGDKCMEAKVLGMLWDTKSDNFKFPLTMAKISKEVVLAQRCPTKREVLKTLMSIYDPLGFLSPFTVCGKIILREVWLASLDWDECITDDIYHKWKMFAGGFEQVAQLQIPRCYTNVEHKYHESVQLHIFVDASESAFAAAAYLRIESNLGIKCSLITSKTKIAPQHPVSIPRLELQAAVIGARLAAHIRSGHKMEIGQQFLWTDSKTVLTWLRSDPRKYRQYVSFRIAEILENTELSQWRWVPSKLNIADLATKWHSSALKLRSDDPWFMGPLFLRQPECEWPTSPPQSFEEPPEELKSQLLHITRKTGILIDVDRFSNWLRLLRCMAYVLRFISNTRNGSQRILGPITAEESKQAENILYQIAQHTHFSDEIASLMQCGSAKDTNACSVEKNSPIYKCSPYLDDEGVLRIKGRIDKATVVCIDTKRPIILPKKHRITLLILRHYHLKFHHQNHETVVNEVRQKFHITSLRATLKKVRRFCAKCKILLANPQPPEMAELSGARLAAFTRPFTYTGIDYFGPMNVIVGRHKEKRWGVIFTCLTIRAIHIEIAYTLSTDSCILAIGNFAARRGMPMEIYSDNGTNFRGASVELKREVSKLNNERIQETALAGYCIKWIFNPPAAPHMGGCWERLIRSIKATLSIVLQSDCPTDEILRTVLMESERTVNSRPLTYIPVESNEDEALTPNHFLLGSSNGEKIGGCFNDSPSSISRNWSISQQLANRFWKRWIREYLPDLTRRTRWYETPKPLQVGDLVLIVEDNAPRNTWRRGIISEVIETRSGHVRQAYVQTPSGILLRPAVKLAVLDVKASDEGVIQ